MKTITLTVRDDATVTVDGVEYPIKAEVKLWTPKNDRECFVLWSEGKICTFTWDKSQVTLNKRLVAGSIRPTRESAEALDRKRRVEGIIFRYFYERGIDTRWKEGVKQYGTALRNGKICVVSYTTDCSGSPFWVDVKFLAEQAIADIPDAIRTALLGGWV